MSLSKTSLNNSLRLTAATLALALAGCGGNQPAYESGESAPANSSGDSSTSTAQSSNSDPTPYEPRPRAHQ